MFNIEFLHEDAEEESMDYPETKLLDSMMAMDAKVKYGYIKSGSYIEDVQYEMPIVYDITGMIRFGNNDVIFLNPGAVGEGNIVHALIHETLHIVIWKIERLTRSEQMARKMLGDHMG